MEKKQSIIIPMLTLRGMTVFPNMIVSLPAGREKSLAAANAAEALSMAAQAAAAAAAAQTTANAAYSPSNQPYAVGTYVGTGVELAVNVGFQPRFLLISCADTKEAYLYTMAAGGGINSVRVEFTSTGFRVKKNYVDTSSSAQQIPYTNSIGTRYLYIAFR